MNSAPILIQPDIVTLRPVLREIRSFSSGATIRAYIIHDCVWRAQAAAEVAARTIDANRKHTHFLSAPTRHGHATGRDLPSAPGWSAGANDPTEILSQGTNQARRGSRPDSARRPSLPAKTSNPLDNCHCARRTKDSDEHRSPLRQRETTTKGSEHRERD